MTEINIENFKEKYADIENSLKKARFIAIDVEYSALYPLKNETPRYINLYLFRKRWLKKGQITHSFQVDRDWL